MRQPSQKNSCNIQILESTIPATASAFKVELKKPSNRFIKGCNYIVINHNDDYENFYI